MRRETAVHFRKSESGDVLCDETGTPLQLVVASPFNWLDAWADDVSYPIGSAVYLDSDSYVYTGTPSQDNWPTGTAPNESLTPVSESITPGAANPAGDSGAQTSYFAYEGIPVSNPKSITRIGSATAAWYTFEAVDPGDVTIHAVWDAGGEAIARVYDSGGTMVADGVAGVDTVANLDPGVYHIRVMGYGGGATGVTSVEVTGDVTNPPVVDGDYGVWKKFALYDAA